MLTASNANDGDRFGHSVDIDGDTIAVSAINEASSATGVGGNEGDNSTESAGAVYVFRFLNGAWSQEAYIKASNSEADDQFGGAISLTEDRLAVSAIGSYGARGEDSAATGINGDQSNNDASRSGAVYVFSRSNGVWSQEAYIKAANTGADDAFGSRIAFDGDILAVASENEDSGSSGINGEDDDDSAKNSGAVYVFYRSTGGGWQQEAYIKASNAEGSDHFESSLALHGSWLAVGAEREDSASRGINGDQASNYEEGSGAVYAFERQAGSWSQHTTSNRQIVRLSTILVEVWPWVRMFS